MRNIDCLPNSPRLKAAELLCDITRGKILSGNAVETLNSCSFPDNRDYALSVNILMGSLQNRRLLDYLLESFSGRKEDSFDGITKAVLETGLYQILFLDRIPFSAAVDESVEIIKLRNPKAAGLVNAVLRKAASAIKNESDKKSFIDRTVTEPELRFSVSHDLYSYLLSGYGYDFAVSFMMASSAFDTTDICINTLKTSVADYEKILTDNGYEYRKSSVSANHIRIFDTHVTSFPGFSEGLFFVQDEAAGCVAEVAEAREGMTILDCCASPGGKSFSAAMLMKDNGEILSCDINPKKTAIIDKGAERLGIHIINTSVLDASAFKPEFASRFDCVICDVPCSGFGVIRKKPEVKFKSFTDIKRLPDIQKAILSNVSNYVKPGGTIVYSTCTVLHEENECPVSDFITENNNFELEPFSVGSITSENGMHTFFPNVEDTDGFFIAKLRRIS